jgi:NADPH:quinone reductase
MSTIPESQKAVFINEIGGPEVIQVGTIPVPKITDEQILVKAEYGGINFSDNYYREGLYPIDKLPHVLGTEGAGIVVQVGSKVSKFKVGDRVGYMTGPAYEEFTALDASNLVAKVPQDLSLKTVAAVYAQGLTALTFVREAYKIQHGDTILVHAPAGGTGGLLIQLAKLQGARVIGITSSWEKAGIAKKHGADELINYKEEDALKRVLDLTDGKGVEAVFDSVGKSTWDLSLAAVARKGTIVSYGNASGPVPPISLLSLSAKNVKVLRPRVGAYVALEEEFDSYSAELFKLLSSGDLTLNIFQEFTFDEYKEAIQLLQSGTTSGKLVVKI